MLYSLKCFNNAILMVVEKQAVSINLRENIDKAAGEMVFNINCYMSKCPPQPTAKLLVARSGFTM